MPSCGSINPNRSQHAVKDGAVGLRARRSRHQPKLGVFSRRTWLPYQLAGCNGLAISREGRRADHAWPGETVKGPKAGLMVAGTWDDRNG